MAGDAQDMITLTIAEHDVADSSLSGDATPGADGTEQEALYTDVYQKREGTWVYVSACAIAPGARHRPREATPYALG